MKVSMNGLRKNMVSAYERAISGYREITEGRDQSEFHLLKSGLDDLRSMIGGLLCTYEPGNPDFIDMSDVDLRSADPADDEESDEE